MIENSGKIKFYERNDDEEAQMNKDIAARFDTGKLRYDLVPGYPLDELAKVYTFGAQKYDADNYLKGMPWRQVIGPALRHLYKWIRGEKYDDESGIHHLAHAAWNIFTLMVYEKEKLGTDDRNPYLLDMMDSGERDKRIVEKLEEKL